MRNNNTLQFILILVMISLCGILSIVQNAKTISSLISARLSNSNNQRALPKD